MDIARKDIAYRKRLRFSIGAGVVFLLVLVTVGLARLEPAPPKVDTASIWTGTVQRGSMVREVRGHGTLVPEEVRWVTAPGGGRIERIPLLPGVAVTPETIILELSNPELVRAEVEAEWEVRVAEARLKRLQVDLENERLARELAIARLKSELALAEIEAETDEILNRRDFVPDTIVRRSRALADELDQRHQLELKSMEFYHESAPTQLLVQEAELNKAIRKLALCREQVAALTVRAGVDGVLQGLGDGEALRVGRLVIAGATIARISDPTRLKAEVRIPEAQAAEVRHGQTALVDTRNAVVSGRVVRIDPAVHQGAVTVDIEFDGSPPSDARPQLSVSCVITIERLDDVLYVTRPAYGREGERVGVFRLSPERKEAVRIPVRFGRNSVSVIEVEEGLNAGDEIILSDTSRWTMYDRLRLN